MFRFVHVSHDNETDRVVETVEMELNSSDQWTDVADFFLRFLQASDFGYLTRQKLSDHFDDGEYCNDCNLRKEQLDPIEDDYEEDDSMVGDNSCESDPDLGRWIMEDATEIVETIFKPKADVYINLFTDEVTVADGGEINE